MLGPVDLRDWDFGEDDLLRAEIRILALAASDGRAMLGPDLSRRLIDFDRGVDFGIMALRRVYADLKAASG
jgi:hypothetical protein